MVPPHNNQQMGGDPTAQGLKQRPSARQPSLAMLQEHPHFPWAKPAGLP